MPCPICGDICRCSSDANAAPPRWLPDLDASSVVSPQGDRDRLEPVLDLHPAEGAIAPSPDESPGEDSQAWRNEVADRLNRYQARRKPRPPRYPSLQLRFEEPAPAATVSNLAESTFFPQRTTVSNHAFALDSFTETTLPPLETLAPTSLPLPRETQNTATLRNADTALDRMPAPQTGKLIEFPRSWTPAPPPLDELAEPVVDRPRILEAPEFVPPPPALGGITIEPAQQPEVEKRPGIDMPLQSAPLARRILAAGIDGVIMATAGVVFGFIFWKLTAIQPPRFQFMGMSGGLLALFWAAYQYLLLVYSGSTPGLRLARLELTRFDGSRVGRRLRRWRVLASFLSAASLGMGYAWVFLDEDSLCWHDRITHTYLAPKKPREPTH